MSQHATKWPARSGSQSLRRAIWVPPTWGNHPPGREEWSGPGPAGAQGGTGGARLEFAHVSDASGGGPDGTRPPLVVVSWCVGSAQGGAAQLIRHQARTVFGVPDTAVSVGRHCASCGSTEHGRPSLARTPGVWVPEVSISRAPGLTVVALTRAGRVGVDVERSAAASFPGFDAVAAHEHEAPDDVEARTVLWVRKESLLKATGRGLAVDPRRIRLTGAQDPPGVVDREVDRLPFGPVQMFDLEITAGYRAALTVLSAARPVVEVRPADPGERPPGATARRAPRHRGPTSPARGR